MFKKILILFIITKVVFSQNKDTTEINLWEGDIRTQVLEEVVFSSLGKDEIKKIVRKIKKSIEDNYKENDSIVFLYDETSDYEFTYKEIEKTDKFSKSIKGKFGLVIPSYKDFYIISKVKDFYIEKNTYNDTTNYRTDTLSLDVKNLNISSPFIIPTMSFTIPMASSIKEMPFINDIGSYKYSGWSDNSTFIINFKPKNYTKKYMFEGKIIINKENYAITYLEYTLVSKNNKTKIMENPYVSSIIPFRIKLLIKGYLLFNSTYRKTLKNIKSDTKHWKTEISYRKKNNKYSLEYVNIETQSYIDITLDAKLTKKLLKKVVKQGNKRRKKRGQDKISDVNLSNRSKEILEKGFFLNNNHKYKLKLEVLDEELNLNDSFIDGVRYIRYNIKHWKRLKNKK